MKKTNRKNIYTYKRWGEQYFWISSLPKKEIERKEKTTCIIINKKICKPVIWLIPNPITNKIVEWLKKMSWIN